MCVFISMHIQKRCAAWFTAVIIKSHFPQKPPSSPVRFGQGGGLLVVMQSLDPWGQIPGSVVESKQAHQGRGAVGATFPLQELALQRAVASNRDSPGCHPVPEQPWSLGQRTGQPLGERRTREKPVETSQSTPQKKHRLMKTKQPTPPKKTTQTNKKILKTNKTSKQKKILKTKPTNQTKTKLKQK